MSYAASENQKSTRPTGAIEVQVNTLESENNRANQLCSRLESLVRRLRGAGPPTPQGLLDNGAKLSEVRSLVERISRSVEGIGNCHSQIDNLLSELDALI